MDWLSRSLTPGPLPSAPPCGAFEGQVPVVVDYLTIEELASARLGNDRRYRWWTAWNVRSFHERLQPKQRAIEGRTTARHKHNEVLIGRPPGAVSTGARNRSTLRIAPSLPNTAAPPPHSTPARCTRVECRAAPRRKLRRSIPRRSRANGRSTRRGISARRADPRDAP